MFIVEFFQWIFNALRILIEYFQFWGNFSILAWAIALTMIVKYFRVPDRGRMYAIALLVALVGRFAADLNKTQLDRYQIDNTAELEKVKQEHEEAKKKHEEEMRAKRISELKAKAADIQFAEDTEEDRLDLAGVKKEKLDELEGYEKEIAKIEAEAKARQQGKEVKQQEDDAKFSYRQRGKQTREIDREAIKAEEEAKAEAENLDITGDVKKKSDDESLDIKEDKTLAKAEQTEHEEIIKISGADYMAIQKFDRFNLFFARLGLWVAFLGFIWNYLNRFNRTFGTETPLPLSCRFIDDLAPKASAVAIASTNADELGLFASRAIRKRETFIYFGRNDAIANERMQVIPKVWSMQRLAYREPQDLWNMEFLHECAYFGRYCITVTHQDLARRVLRDLLIFLRIRVVPRAAARQTVNVIWDFEARPPRRLIAELAELGRLCNYRFIVVMPEEELVREGNIYDEVYPPKTEMAAVRLESEQELLQDKFFAGLPTPLFAISDDPASETQLGEATRSATPKAKMAQTATRTREIKRAELTAPAPAESFEDRDELHEPEKLESITEPTAASTGDKAVHSSSVSADQSPLDAEETVDEAKILLKCERCQKKLKVKQQFQGKVIKCPACAHKIRVPTPQVPA